MLLTKIVTHRVPIQPFHWRDGHASKPDFAARPSHRVLVLNRALAHWCLQPAVMNRSPNSTTSSIVPQPTFTMFGRRASIYTRITKETSAETVLPVSLCYTPRLTQRLIATCTPNEVCSSQLLLSCSFMKKAGLFKMGLKHAVCWFFCHCSAGNQCFGLSCWNVWTTANKCSYKGPPLYVQSIQSTVKLTEAWYSLFKWLKDQQIKKKMFLNMNMKKNMKKVQGWNFLNFH